MIQGASMIQLQGCVHDLAIRVCPLQQSTMQKLQLKDLVSALSPEEPTQNAVSSTTQQFLATPSAAVKNLPLREQLALKRESTYRNTQHEMDKWVGIVKLNREKDTLNLVKNEKGDGANVNFFPAAPINDFHKRIEGQLKQMEVECQQTVIRKEEAALGAVSKEEAKERLQQARKQRTAQFNEEIKRRRIAKIKSKLYHRIKKRQKTREEVKRVSELEGEEKEEYNQKVVRRRIEERITLRHRTKTRHIQDLLRFSKNSKDTIQESLNKVNAIRRQQLEKITDEAADNLSSEMDEENYRENIQDLQQEIDQMEHEEPHKQGLDSMKFMQNGRKKEIGQEKQELQNLARMFNSEAIDVEQQQQDPQEVEEKEVTRKTLGENLGKGKSVEVAQNYIQRNLKQTLGDDAGLTQGINVTKLREKYQPQQSGVNLTEALKLHRDNEAGNNEVIEENYRDFEKEKYADYEADLPVEQKKLKGWGNWAGPGISEPKVDHAAEVQKKLAKIAEIKRKRRDGEMAGAIVRQTYNKDLKDYFVKKLPHNIKSAEQFNYLQGQPVGPEWNTLTQFSANIKPKVITKAGQVIQPIKMPKTIERGKK